MVHDKDCTACLYPLCNIPIISEISGTLQGPLEFAATSHKDDIGRNLGISGESERKIQAAVQNAGYQVNGEAFQLGAHT